MHRISTALEGGGHIVTGSSTLESHDGMPFAQQNTHTTQMSYCSVLVYSNLSEITWVCVSRLKCFSNCGLVRQASIGVNCEGLWNQLSQSFGGQG